ncbi:MAG: hypothetical protein FWH04_07175 [Oscillospiraceae bacterium]|nr:hypothetical protein [Oscillospiraceae bacterium]
MILETIIALLAAIGTIFLAWYFCVWTPPTPTPPRKPEKKAEEILSDGEAGRTDTIRCLRQ